jgi:pantoate--beta-alanine ligase
MIIMSEPTQLPTSPTLASTVADLRLCVAGWRAQRERVAMVPTMGALHAGHLDLVRLARTHADRVVVSIFVNPAQFAPHEDFDSYPRTLEADMAKLAPLDVDAVFAPNAREMYPAGFATRIVPEGAALGLETVFRPHFFGGVTTVVCKLLLSALPDFAVFGEKDYQQLAVVRQMVRDLNIPTTIIGAPTTRADDGLALSSRNAYLDARERAAAPVLHDTLNAIATAVRGGAAIAPTLAEGEARIRAAGFRGVDYLALCDAETLAPLDTLTPAPARLLVAAWIGRTRLIDNIAV